MQSVDVSGLVQVLALALPVFALVTMMVIAARQVARKRRADHQLTGRYGVPLPQKEARSPVPASTPTPTPTPTPAPTPAIETLDVDAVAARVARAEAKDANADLPPLYLELARARIVRGEGQDAAELLRKCIRIAAKHGQKAVHASARLELGDLVREDGDLTTACEHWQIARGLFYELKRDAELAQSEQRMRQNGCPTDWVLNDF